MPIPLARLGLQGGGKLSLAFGERLLGPAARCAPLAAELVCRGLLPVLLEPVPTGRAVMMYGPDGGVQQVTVSRRLRFHLHCEVLHCAECWMRWVIQQDSSNS